MFIRKLQDKIIEHRKANDWSQEDFADKLNVSRQAISRWENATALFGFSFASIHFYEKRKNENRNCEIVLPGKACICYHVYPENGDTTDTHCAFSFIEFEDEELKYSKIP